MTDIPKFGKDIRVKEFPLKDCVVFTNHGSYGVAPIRIKEAQFRYCILYELSEYFPLSLLVVYFNKIRMQKDDKYCSEN